MLEISPNAKMPNVVGALAVAVVVMAVEYGCRHYVLFWMPTFGTLGVNDMVALVIAYGGLLAVFGRLTNVDWAAALRGIGAALREVAMTWNGTAWFTALVACAWALPFVDRLLWGGLQLPMLLSDYRNPAVWFASQAIFLKDASLIVVNGLFAPVAEEFLWRGLVQPHFGRALPRWAAIGLTAVLFSVKHVLVDASLGRFLMVIGFGIICGLRADRKTWQASAALHLLVNTAATLSGIMLGLQ